MSGRTATIAGQEVRFVPAKRFKEPKPHKFKEILGRLIENPETVAEIECDSVEAAKEMQAGFHSSGNGRKLKSEGYRIETTCQDTVVQVRVSKNGKNRVA